MENMKHVQWKDKRAVSGGVCHQASSGGGIKKQKRLSTARKSDLTMEWMKACELWLGIQLWMTACYSFSRDKRDIFSSEILVLKYRPFTVFTDSGFFGVYIPGTIAAVCLMEYKAESGHCGFNMPACLFNKLLTSYLSAEFQANPTHKGLASSSTENPGFHWKSV